MQYRPLNIHCLAGLALVAAAFTAGAQTPNPPHAAVRVVDVCQDGRGRLRTELHERLGRLALQGRGLELKRDGVRRGFAREPGKNVDQ